MSREKNFIYPTNEKEPPEMHLKAVGKNIAIPANMNELADSKFIEDDRRKNVKLLSSEKLLELYLTIIFNNYHTNPISELKRYLDDSQIETMKKFAKSKKLLDYDESISLKGIEYLNGLHTKKIMQKQNTINIWMVVATILMAIATFLSAIVVFWK
jgi:hypothetical protein